MFFPGLNMQAYSISNYLVTDNRKKMKNWKQFTLYSVAQKACSTTIIGDLPYNKYKGVAMMLSNKHLRILSAYMTPLTIKICKIGRKHIFEMNFFAVSIESIKLIFMRIKSNNTLSTQLLQVIGWPLHWCSALLCPFTISAHIATATSNSLVSKDGKQQLI